MRATIALALLPMMVWAGAYRPPAVTAQIPIKAVQIEGVTALRQNISFASRWSQVLSIPPRAGVLMPAASERSEAATVVPPDRVNTQARRRPLRTQGVSLNICQR